MKLQNNQTGQVENFCIDKDQICSCDRAFVYDSLTQLQEAGWEDYEEPREFYIIERRGMVGSRFRTDDGYEEDYKEIGNYFETEEEAEKAVEKLKAWKRLKDAGVRFDECRPEYQRFEIYYVMPERPVKEYEQIFADIYLLFGGGE